MDSSEVTAIVALVVSLIALLIALLQLLQSSALSAEGWRQCNRAVIGKWSVFSRRKWLWSELRFEVLFTIPKIQILHAADFETRRSVWVTEGFKRDLPHVAKSIANPVFKPGARFKQPEAKSAREAAHLLGVDSLPNSIERAWSSSLDNALLYPNTTPHASLRPSGAGNLASFWLSCRRWCHGYHFRWKPTSRPDQKIAITWDSLLNAVCQQQARMFRIRSNLSPPGPFMPQTPSVDNDAAKQHVKSEPAPSARQAPHQPRLDTEETLICVELEQKSWDFLPTDARPLAVSNLRTVVILARRLGMRWKIFDRAANQYHAEAKDCSLSATSIRGLGLVFRFDSRPQHPSNQLVMWSTSADKAYFGIVAGDPNLDVDDYRVVGSDLVVHTDSFIRENLGELPYRMKKCGSHLGRILLNDFVALVSPFMPHPEGQSNRIYSPIPSGNRSETVRSLSLFEAIAYNDKFRKELSKNIARFMPPAAKVQTTLDFFQRLDDSFQEDIQRRYSRKQDKTQKSIPPRDTNDFELMPKEINERRRKIAFQREIHKCTTLFFGGDFERTAGDVYDGGTKYNYPGAFASLKTHRGMFKDIMKAHMHLLAHCYFDKFHKSKRDEWKKPMPWNDAERELSDGMEVFEDLIKRMVDNLPVFRESLYDQWHGYRDVFQTDDEVDMLWWMMVARGVAWQVSVKVLQPYHSGVVPSDIYDSDMTVWIE